MGVQPAMGLAPCRRHADVYQLHRPPKTQMFTRESASAIHDRTGDFSAVCLREFSAVCLKYYSLIGVQENW